MTTSVENSNSKEHRIFGLRSENPRILNIIQQLLFYIIAAVLMGMPLLVYGNDDFSQHHIENEKIDARTIRLI